MKLIVFLSLINVVLSDYDYEFTEKIASQCKSYTCTKGYSYEDYFKVTGGHKSPGIKFEIHIAIKAENNGHILLASSKYLRTNDPVYEITVGAGYNSFTELRRLRTRMGLSTTNTAKILDKNKFVPFWIKVHDDGLVEFGKEGQITPIVSHNDTSPLDVKYFSFASWKNIKAEVLYDCPINGNFTDESEIVLKNLTDVERLRQDLLKDYDKYRRPVLSESTITSLMLYYSVKSVSFDVTKSILTTHGNLIAHWIDHLLLWDPADYDNITYMNFNTKEIWKPEIKIFDSLDLNDIEWKDGNVLINHEGGIVSTAHVMARTWCSPSEDLVHWPHDTHVCALRMGLWSQHAQLNISTNKEFSQNDPMMMGNEVFYPTEWEMLGMGLSSDWSNYSPYVQLSGEESDDDNDNDGKTRNTFSISMMIRRIDKTYNATLYAPFICTILMILITFWVSTSTTVKVTILCVELFFVLMFLVEVMDKIPAFSEQLPHIVLFYFWAMISIWLSIIVNLIVFKMRSDPQPWMDRSRKFLSSLRINNCLIFHNIEVEESYATLQTNDADKCEEDNESHWKMVGVTLDRIIFTVFTVVFSIYCCFN
ncbi:acetylcholine receptor subunit alpha-L1-like [Arctopsyche grandis]|uniref:acetylcholine receptor subunit alpha-L1-like n=1 Tax=Arctopsyche grandis TaxID=121162 RepID=UPI00406D6B8D